jgi:hypothetical protein
MLDMSSTRLTWAHLAFNALIESNRLAVFALVGYQTSAATMLWIPACYNSRLVKIRKLAQQRGLTCSKNQRWLAV